MNSAEAKAKAILKEKGKSFYWAQKLLSRKQALDATRLYAICRHVDDLVDEADSIEDAKQQLSQFRLETLNGYFFHRAQINESAFLELTNGVESDLGRVRIETEAELLAYCYQVAGTVGIMMCDVLGVNDPRAIKHASDLGVAMQLTNICRDVKEDAKLERRYLPATLVGNMSLRELESPSILQKAILNQALQSLLTLADGYYESGEKGLIYLPFRARFAILVAARIYREIGVKLKLKEGDYWTVRVSVSGFRKLFITIRAFFDFVTHPVLWTPRTVTPAESRWK